MNSLHQNNNLLYFYRIVYLFQFLKKTVGYFYMMSLLQLKCIFNGKYFYQLQSPCNVGHDVNNVQTIVIGVVTLKVAMISISNTTQLSQSIPISTIEKSWI